MISRRRFCARVASGAAAILGIRVKPKPVPAKMTPIQYFFSGPERRDILWINGEQRVIVSYDRSTRVATLASSLPPQKGSEFLVCPARTTC